MAQSHQRVYGLNMFIARLLQTTKNVASSVVAKVFEVTAGCWTPLTVILRTTRTRTIWIVGRSCHLHETHLADLHTWIQRDGQACDIGKFERDVTVKTSVDESGC